MPRAMHAFVYRLPNRFTHNYLKKHILTFSILCSFIIKLHKVNPTPYMSAQILDYIPELFVESVSRLATVLDLESPPRLESTD